MGSACEENGENIAPLNPFFSELTGMYWIYENDASDVKGIVHYRRFFTTNSLSSSTAYVLSTGEILDILSSHDCIVPRKKYVRPTVRAHYEALHDGDDYAKLAHMVRAQSPDTMPAFGEASEANYLYPYNMMIAKSHVFDEYASWLFDLLLPLYEEISTEGRDAYQSRVMGFLSERLLGVWLRLKSDSLAICELPVLSTNESFFRRALSAAEYKLGVKIPNPMKAEKRVGHPSLR